jgi:prepilin peptidase CpaA
MKLYLFIFVFLELTVVALGDLKHKTIPNLWSILNIIAFIVLGFMEPELYSFGWKTYIYSSVFFLVGFSLFLMNIMGAGDTKLLVTLFLLIPTSLQGQYLLMLLHGTVFIGGSMRFYHRIKNYNKIIVYLGTKDVAGLKSCFGSKFPFAPVVWISWLLFGWEVRTKF